MSKAAGGSKRNRNRKVRKDNPLSYQVNHFIIGKRCDNCDKRDSDGVHIRFCSGCKSKDYCSPECQRAAWPSHKAICKETQNAKKDPDSMRTVWMLGEVRARMRSSKRGTR